MSNEYVSEYVFGPKNVGLDRVEFLQRGINAHASLQELSEGIVEYLSALGYSLNKKFPNMLTMSTKATPGLSIGIEFKNDAGNNLTRIKARITINPMRYLNVTLKKKMASHVYESLGGTDNFLPGYVLKKYGPTKLRRKNLLAASKLIQNAQKDIEALLEDVILGRYKCSYSYDSSLFIQSVELVEDILCDNPYELTKAIERQFRSTVSNTKDSYYSNTRSKKQNSHAIQANLRKGIALKVYTKAVDVLRVEMIINRIPLRKDFKSNVLTSSTFRDLDTLVSKLCKYSTPKIRELTATRKQDVGPPSSLKELRLLLKLIGPCLDNELRIILNATMAHECFTSQGMRKHVLPRLCKSGVVTRIARNTYCLNESIVSVIKLLDNIISSPSQNSEIAPQKQMVKETGMTNEKFAKGIDPFCYTFEDAIREHYQTNH